MATLGGVQVQASRMAVSALEALCPTGISSFHRSKRRLRNGRTVGIWFLSMTMHSLCTVHLDLVEQPCRLTVGGSERPECVAGDALLTE